MKIMPPSKMIGRWIYTSTARHRFLVERDAHQIAEDATNMILLEDETIRMGSGYTHVTYDPGIDLDMWDHEDEEAPRCPHCGAENPGRNADVYDSGEPFYVLGFSCQRCGRFIEQED